MLNALVLLLALVKASLVLRVLYGRMPRRAMAYVGAELAVLFLMPTAFKWFERHGAVGGAEFYAGWCAVGLLLAAYEMQGRFFGTGEVAEASGLALTIRRLYTALPIVSIIAHLGMLHWVYNVTFTPVHAAPLALGSAIVLNRLAPSLIGLRVALPVMALVFSAGDPALFHMPLLGRVELTPIVLMAGAAYLAIVYSFFLSRMIYFIAAATAVAAMIAVGPTPTQIGMFISAIWSECCDLGDRLRPRTAMQWGMVSLGAAFGFLAIGAGVSLRKDPAAHGVSLAKTSQAARVMADMPEKC
jgi:hypothetical protein